MLANDTAAPSTLIGDVLRRNATKQPWRRGQVCYQCVSIAVGAGRKLCESPSVQAVLTLIDFDRDREELREHGSAGLRRLKLLRMCEEARDQGGALTQVDLGILLGCDEKTVRKDIKSLRRRGVQVPTRGYVQGIGGPVISDK